MAVREKPSLLAGTRREREEGGSQVKEESRNDVKMETSSKSLERQERSEKKGNKPSPCGFAAATVRSQQNCPCHTWITAFHKSHSHISQKEQSRVCMLQATRLKSGGFSPNAACMAA